jgi:hypothetical protein
MRDRKCKLEFPGASSGPPSYAQVANLPGLGLEVSPIQARLWGLGAVPTLFVSWPELQTAAADGILTPAELKSLPSVRIGYGSFFSMEFHPWAPGDDRRGANVQISARGSSRMVDNSSYKSARFTYPSNSGMW